MTKYLKRKDGKWIYSPPRKAVYNGIVSHWSEDNESKAHARATQDNRKVTLWRKGKLAGSTIDKTSNLSQVAAHYMGTAHYNHLSYSSKKSYRYMFKKVCSFFDPLSIQKIDVNRCQVVYDQWVEESLPNSKMMVRGFSLLINHAISLGALQMNPMVHVKKVTSRTENRTWKKEEVIKFIDTAFTKWEWRNIGIMALLCYEYAQRPIDIATLKWDNVDFDTNTITISQSKRGAKVYLPMDGTVREVLLNQYQDFKFQEWVIPQLRAMDNAYRPYNNTQFALLAKEVIEEAGLDEDLKLGKLRNTAIVEMVDAGVDSTQIMSVSGHVNIQSLNPYLKNTRAGAEAALNRRKGI